jgi:hypothetical protein
LTKRNCGAFEKDEDPAIFEVPKQNGRAEAIVGAEARVSRLRPNRSA